ncbi:MAG TPA: hypothetical protein VF548_03755 [Allosphingosinicella sp.]
MCAIAPRRRPRAARRRQWRTWDQEFEARAAVFRRLAAELRSEPDRVAPIAVAEEYEAEAQRLRGAPAAG